jgi:hypothetical protein
MSRKSREDAECGSLRSIEAVTGAEAHFRKQVHRAGRAVYLDDRSSMKLVGYLLAGAAFFCFSTQVFT